DDDDEERSDSLEDNIISGLPPCSAITPNEPVLSTEEPDNSLIAPYYLLSLRNEDTIFDPGICNSYFSRPDVSHRCRTFPRFKVLPERPMEIFSSICSPMDK
nr:hypothetical protein [Tanacetum cinerariifolium]